VPIRFNEPVTECFPGHIDLKDLIRTSPTSAVFTAIDKLVVEIDNALRTLAATAASTRQGQRSIPFAPARP